LKHISTRTRCCESGCSRHHGTFAVEGPTRRFAISSAHSMRASFNRDPVVGEVPADADRHLALAVRVGLQLQALVLDQRIHQGWHVVGGSCCKLHIAMVRRTGERVILAPRSNFVIFSVPVPPGKPMADIRLRLIAHATIASRTRCRPRAVKGMNRLDMARNKTPTSVSPFSRDFVRILSCRTLSMNNNADRDGLVYAV